MTAGKLRRWTRVLRVNARNRLSTRKVTDTADVAVAVTSFGSRIETCALAIESIAAGTVRPAKMFIGLEDGLRGQPLPASVERLIARGLSVVYGPDLRSHKKYFFFLQQCISQNMPLVVIDDDFLYPQWFLERILAAAETERDAIWFYRAREMKFYEGGNLAPYDQWPFANHETPALRFFFTSGGGTYLPVVMLKNLLIAGRGFEKVCPRADDVWLNYLASAAGIPKRLILQSSTDFTPIDLPVEQTLWTENSRGGNDSQLSATYDPQTLRVIAGMSAT